MPPLKQAKEDQETEIQNLIKKNIIHDKASFGKIQLHNKTINSKTGDPSVAPERYHSSKLLKREKLQPVPKEQLLKPKELQVAPMPQGQTLKVDRS